MPEAPKPKPGAPLPPRAPVGTTPKAPGVTAPRVPGAPTPPRAPSHSVAEVAEVTKVHAPAPVEVLPSDAPDSGWSAPPPPMPPEPAIPVPAKSAPVIPPAAASAPVVHAPAVHAPAASASVTTAELRKIAREAIEEALGSLRTSQRDLDARLKTIEHRLEQLAHRPPPLPAASPAPAPVAPAPAFAAAPMVPAFAPAPVAATATATATSTATPTSTSIDIPVSLAPPPMRAPAPSAMDSATHELMRLANSPVTDDMMGGEFDGTRRSRRLKLAFGFFIFLVIAGAIASILVSQSMNSHG